MPTNLTWQEVAIRLALTVIAGAIVGFNRGEHGRAAGFRTSILVCLAASVSMIQANLLLMTHGRPTDSFIMMDLMRLPLGILSGMGFIGGGAILKRGKMIKGVTTAATLWFLTVMGLCFGGGQIGLGIACLALGMFVLSVLKKVDDRMIQDRRGILSALVSADGPVRDEFRTMLQAAGFSISSCAVAYSKQQRRLRLRFNVCWRDHAQGTMPPKVIDELARRDGVLKLQWSPINS